MLGVGLAVMIGWVLFIGQSILIPVIASVIVAYILMTLARRMGEAVMHTIAVISYPNIAGF